MVMTKKAFFDKIESGEVIHIGRYSCQRWGQDYYFSGETTEMLGSLDELWDRVRPFLAHVTRDKGEQK